MVAPSGSIVARRSDPKLTVVPSDLAIKRVFKLEPEMTSRLIGSAGPGVLRKMCGVAGVIVTAPSCGSRPTRHSPARRHRGKQAFIRNNATILRPAQL